MNNYIGPINAEWVDPAVELPPERLIVQAKTICNCEIVIAAMVDPRCWWTSGGMGCGPNSTGKWTDGSEIIAWLRIGGPSDAIPRAKVQAAADELARQGFPYSSDIAAGLLGVTPTEVTP